MMHLRYDAHMTGRAGQSALAVREVRPTVWAILLRPA